MDDQYFDDSSVLRRVHREQVVALSGPRALLMQAAHPVAFAGFFMSTGALGDPYRRLQRTADVLDTVIWGSRAAASSATSAVRRIHSTKRGTLPQDVGSFPAGTPWAADDPRLLLWILATLTDSAWVVHERYVATLKRIERDAYWNDMRVVGRLFGVADSEMPDTSRDLEIYLHDMIHGETLHVSAQARRLGIEIVLNPPVPVIARPLRELVNFITVGLLPTKVRQQYRLGWDPVRAATLNVGAMYVRRLLVPVLPASVRHRANPVAGRFTEANAA